MNGARLSVCLINRNGARCLPESLKGLRDIEGAFAEILMVDDASEDRSVEIFRDHFPYGRVIRFGENRGPAAARNAGFAKASGARILFVDNDVRLDPECAHELVRALDANPRAAAAMPRVLYARAPRVIQYDGAECHFLGLMTLHNVDKTATDAPGETRAIGSLVTACFLLDRRRWGGDAPFDESFFFNYEDHDFGVRLRCLGHEILSVPSARCYHGEGTPGLSVRLGGTYPRDRIHYLIRNRWQLVLKTYEARTMVILAPALLVYEACQLAGMSAKGRFREWRRAALWMARNVAAVLGKRRLVQRARRTGDAEILRGGPLPLHAEFARTAVERAAIRLLDGFMAAYWRLAGRFL